MLKNPHTIPIGTVSKCHNVKRTAAITFRKRPRPFLWKGLISQSLKIFNCQAKQYIGVILTFHSSMMILFKRFNVIIGITPAYEGSCILYTYGFIFHRPWAVPRKIRAIYKNRLNWVGYVSYSFWTKCSRQSRLWSSVTVRAKASLACLILSLT